MRSFDVADHVENFPFHPHSDDICIVTISTMHVVPNSFRPRKKIEDR